MSSLSIIAGLSGIIPSLSLNSHTIKFDNTAHAQTATDIAQTQTFSLNTIWRYAQALQEINPIREQHKKEITIMFQGDRPERVCYLDNMPWEVQQSCQRFGTKMFDILQKYQMQNIYTPISIQAQSNKNLERKIQKAGTCQQRRISLEDCF